MIDVINLRKSFGDLEILKGINITINKGDIVAVLRQSFRKKYVSALLKLYGRSDIRKHCF